MFSIYKKLEKKNKLFFKYIEFLNFEQKYMNKFNVFIKN